MKEILLTQNKIALVDDDDYDKINRYKWCANFDGNKWYALRSIRKSTHKTAISMQRELLGLEFGDDSECDHKNGNGLDNQKYNLRICSHAENCRNRKLRIGCTSKFKGVYWNKQCKKWHSRIQYNFKTIHLGYFNSEIEAAAVYDNAAIKYHGEFAKLNLERIA